MPRPAVMYLRSQRNTISKQIGGLMAKGQKEEAEAAKAQVTAMAKELAELGSQGDGMLEAEIRKRMLVIPNIIDRQRARSARTTARTWSWSGLGSRLCRILRCPTMWISWSG